MLFSPQSTKNIIVQMHIPTEIVLIILEPLKRSHLKSARLVCKAWSSCASQILFDKIYVAPNKIDLEVFNETTQHPILRECVRRLVYDASVFVSDLTREGYVWGLLKQMRDPIRRGEAIPESMNPEMFNDWMYDCSLIEFDDERLPELVTKWKDHSVFNRGYEVPRTFCLPAENSPEQISSRDPDLGAFKAEPFGICVFGRRMGLGHAKKHWQTSLWHSSRAQMASVSLASTRVVLKARAKRYWRCA